MPNSRVSYRSVRHTDQLNQPLAIGKRYFDKVVKTDPDNLILYIPNWETSGTVAVDYSPKGTNGAHDKVDLGYPGIGDGSTAVSYNGASNHTNIYSTGFRSNFETSAGTMMAWIKVGSASVWNDGAGGRAFTLRADTSNGVVIQRLALTPKITPSYMVNTSDLGNQTGVTCETGWMHFALTWNCAGCCITYQDGKQFGAANAIVQGWGGGSVGASLCNIGAGNTANQQPWTGFVAHAALWRKDLTPTQIAYLGTLG